MRGFINMFQIVEWTISDTYRVLYHVVNGPQESQASLTFHELIDF